MLLEVPRATMDPLIHSITAPEALVVPVALEALTPASIHPAPILMKWLLTVCHLTPQCRLVICPLRLTTRYRIKHYFVKALFVFYLLTLVVVDISQSKVSYE